MIFVLGPEEHIKLNTLREHAEQNPLNMDDMLDTLNGEMKAVGLMDKFTCYIPDSFKIVYSIEQQLPGDIRHLSISCEEKVAPISVVQLVMDQLGFTTKLDNVGPYCKIFPEDIGDEKIAINVMELIEGSPVRK